MINYDSVIVGLGLRGLTVASYFSQEEYNNGRILLVERSSIIGPGIFHRYRGSNRTNSVGRKFFSEISYSGVLSGLANNSKIEALDNTNHNVTIASLSDDLVWIGGKLLECVPRKHVVLGSEVESVKIEPEGNIKAFLSSGEVVSTKSIILCTGREEKNIATNIKEHFFTSFLSNEVLGNVGCLDNYDTIVICGGSHSAFSIVDQIKQRKPDTVVKIYTRTMPVPFFYSLKEARNVERKIGLKLFDSDKDVCVRTGQVNRDSGIREPGRMHLVNALMGNDESLEIKITHDPYQYFGNLAGNENSAFVQAFGFYPVGPKIVFNNSEQIDVIDTSVTEEGEAVVTSLGVLPGVYLVRLHKTPTALKNRNPELQRNYERIAKKVRKDCFTERNA